MSDNSRARSWGGMALCVMLLCVPGCAMGPNFVRPTPVLPEQWHNATEGVSTLPASTPWWKQFESAALNSLMLRAEKTNPDMAMARERIRAARIQRGAASAEGLPSITGQAAYSRERLATAGVGQVLQPLLGLNPNENGYAPEGVSYTNYSVGAVASWELDLWGHQRRLQEAATAGLEAVRADMQAMRLSTQAEIARTYFQWLECSAQQQHVEAAYAVTQSLLTSAQATQSHGLLAAIDLDEQKALLHTARIEKEELAAKRAALYRALAVLVAGRPDALMPELTEQVRLETLKIPDIAVGIPSDMARRRPDIRAAEARLHGATATIGMAQADFYPQITLTGQFSLDALTLSELGWNARNTSFGPTLTLPIFNGGRLSSQLALRHSEQRSAGLIYQAVVLNAWVEIENLLANRKVLLARYAEQVSAQAENQARITALSARYRRGDTAKIEVLTAQRSGYESDIDRAQSVAALFINAVNLATAVGSAA